MPVDERYRRQVDLLVRTLPHVAQEKCFALKGGTAINLFVRNLPRLSVDIDLTYLPVAGRARSLENIEVALRRIGERIEGAFPFARVQAGVLREEGTVNKLFVRERGTQIKVEVTPVLRGCVFEPEEKTVSDAVEEQFGFAAIQVVSFPDLFAGKLVATLDRQHPRDLFDVHDLLSNEGIDDGLRAAFIVYLISHHRPIERLLAPARRDMREEFERGLAGMMEVPVALEVLVRTREELVAEIVGRMPDAHREFLRSLARGEPEWSLLEVRNVSSLPAVEWRMRKLARFDEVERSAMAQRVEAALTDTIDRGPLPASTGFGG